MKKDVENWRGEEYSGVVEEEIKSYLPPNFSEENSFFKSSYSNASQSEYFVRLLCETPPLHVKRNLQTFVRLQ